MKGRKLQGCLIAALAVLASASALPLRADGTNTATDASNNNGNGASGGNSFLFPGNIPGPRQNLTPEQLRSIMVYRALQSRGSGQVRRGVPQFIPFGALGFDNAPQAMQGQPAGGADPAAAQQSDRDAAKEAARQKRIEALKAAAEKQKAAREARAAERTAQQAKQPAGGK